eukprot:3004748-Rhodomonas_salina.1
MQHTRRRLWCICFTSHGAGHAGGTCAYVTQHRRWRETWRSLSAGFLAASSLGPEKRRTRMGCCHSQGFCITNACVNVAAALRNQRGKATRARTNTTGKEACAI